MICKEGVVTNMFQLISSQVAFDSYTSYYDLNTKTMVSHVLQFTQYELDHEQWKCLSDVPDAFKEYMSAKDKLLYTIYNIYYISNLGRVAKYDIDKNSLLLVRAYTDRSSYKNVLLKSQESQHTYKVHRLVGYLFVRNPDIKHFTIINHIKEFEKYNNKAIYLEWCDAKYNSRYGTARDRISSKVSKALANRKHSKSSCKLVSPSHQYRCKPFYFKSKSIPIQPIVQLNEDYTVYSIYLTQSYIDRSLYAVHQVLKCCNHQKKKEK